MHYNPLLWESLRDSGGGKHHGAPSVRVLSNQRPVLGWSLQGINALYFMDIKSCVSFTELRTLVLYLGVFVIGKNTPQSKISRVKWWNNITLFNFSHFFLFLSIHVHNLPNYTRFSYLDSKFPSRNMCTEYQFRGKNDWIWVYPPIV